jgi:hypothetical protein
VHGVCDDARELAWLWTYGARIGEGIRDREVAVSEKLVAMSARKVNELLKRDQLKLRPCALLLDGVEVKQQHLVTALGIDETGRKTIVGFHQGASEKTGTDRCRGCFQNGRTVERGGAVNRIRGPCSSRSGDGIADGSLGPIGNRPAG